MTALKIANLSPVTVVAVLLVKAESRRVQTQNATVQLKVLLERRQFFLTPKSRQHVVRQLRLPGLQPQGSSFAFVLSVPFTFHPPLSSFLLLSFTFLLVCWCACLKPQAHQVLELEVPVEPLMQAQQAPRQTKVKVPTGGHKIKLLTRPKRLLNERIQGLSGLRVRVSGPMLCNFVELQQRKLCVRCSLGHGPEDKDSSNKQNGDAYDKSRRTLAVSSGSTISLTKRIVIRGLKIIISLMVMLSLALVGTPFALSSRLGRRSVLSVVNKFIPGQIDVQSLSLGWTKPVRAEGISLKGIDKKVVLSILKLETEASLWSLVRGKSGLELGS
ncbi:hypothetical protein L7F22_034540 [Adiantum nelumboides]|nr:hypothetical protein [Adiantum nelumboides]